MMNLQACQDKFYKQGLKGLKIFRIIQGQALTLRDKIDYHV